MTSECCSEASVAAGAGEDGLITPVPTATAKTLALMALSMLGWDHTKLSLEEDAVRRYILAQYPLQGQAPSRGEISDALGLRQDVTQTILERLHELDILYLEPDRCEIRLAYPFSSVPTRHTVKFDDWAEAKPVYAQCAIDALGIPFMFKHDLSIASSCAHCSKPIAIAVRDRAIVAHNPAEIVVWAGTTRSGHAATSVCPTINFFCSSDHVAAWLRDETDPVGSMVNLGEALYIGNEIFEPLLTARSGSTGGALESAQTGQPGKVALTATSVGGLVTAFLASVCCVGPLIFAALGVGVGATGFLASTAGALKAFLPYRPWFIGLTVLLLGVGFYIAYRTPRVFCGPSASCAPTGGKPSPRTLLWIFSIIAMALVLAPYWLGL